MEAVKEFDSLLSDLKSRRDNNTCDMFVPSVQETLAFKPITVTQQSDIISSLLVQERDSNAYAYSKVINKIITDNVVESADLFRGFDRSAILIQMRINTIGSQITIDEHDIDLNVLSDNFKLTEDEISLLTDSHTYDESGIEVSYQQPLLSRETQIAEAAEDKWKDLEGEDIITELFVIELVKYINMVSFDDNQMIFNELTFDQCMQVCNILPMAHSRKIMEYVQQTKDIESRFFTIEVDEETSVQVPLNTALFSTGT